MPSNSERSASVLLRGFPRFQHATETETDRGENNVYLPVLCQPTIELQDSCYGLTIGDMQQGGFPPSRGFAQQKVRCPLSAVGAVYDRAFVPLKCENRAVIDRAYSKKVCVCLLLCKSPSRHRLSEVSVRFCALRHMGVGYFSTHS